MKKKSSTSFYFSDEVKELLKLLAEKHGRSQANLLEYLIKQEAQRLNITLPPKP